MQIGEAFFLFFLGSIATVSIMYFIFKARYKNEFVKIDNLEKLNVALNSKIKELEEKLNERDYKGSKAGFVIEQIKKNEALDLKNKKLKQQLEDAKKIAQKASMIKYDFLSNVRHEVRTPMNSILVFAEMLKDELKDKTLLSYAENVFQSGHKLLNLIDDIIELSKIESGTFTLEENAVESRIIFESIVQSYKNIATKKGLDLSLHIDDTLPDSLILDSAKVQDIITNLVDNAIKFTNNGFVKIDVIVENINISRNVVDLSILVEDSGIGIDEKNQEKIFEIFESKEKPSDIEFEGAGLGLSINKKLANLMNGDITFTSEPQQGSVFKFSLDDVEIVLASSEDVVDDADIDFALIKDNSTMVVIDDMDETHERMKNYFMNSSSKVFTFKTVGESIETLKTKKIDLLFIDVEMLNIDDGAVSKVIAKMNDAPVVALTNNRLKNVVLSEGGVTPVAYLKKPISKLELFKLSLKILNSANLYKTQAVQSISSEVALNPAQMQNIQEFIAVYNEELKEIYETALSTNDLRATKQFAESLLKLATKYEIEEFVNYSKTLLGHIELFEIETIHSLIKNYREKLLVLQSTLKG